MARVAILEPDPETRELLARFVRQLAHEPVLFNDGLTELESEVDAVVVEPASVRRLRTAQELRRRLPDLPVICVSIDPANEAGQALGPIAYIEKPFLRTDLAGALERALASRPGSAA